MVRAVPAANNVPTLCSRWGLRQEAWTRTHLRVRDVGEPVVANDAPGDVLTYTLDRYGGDEANYRIDQATGQITVGPRATLDREANGDPFTHRVTVTAIDPADGKQYRAQQ